MVIVIAFGPQMIKKASNDAAPPPQPPSTPRNDQPTNNSDATDTSEALPGGLQPIVKKQTQDAIYVLVASQLVGKMKPDALLLTFQEGVHLTLAIAKDLRETMGLEIPPTYLVPKGIPDAWVATPVYTSIEDCQYQWDLYRANEKFVNNIVDQLVNNYSSKTVAILGQEFAKVPQQRQKGTEDTLHFIQDIYGPDFMSRYYTEHQSKLDKDAKPFPDRLKNEAEADISSYWRTEFTDEELEQLKGYIAANGLGVKLMEDLQTSNMSEAEHGLMETTLIGYRLNIMHTVTCTLVSAYAARGNLYK